MNTRLTADDLQSCLQSALPVRRGDIALELVDEPIVERNGHLFGTLRLFVYEDGSIRDIKEQQVLFVDVDARDGAPERLQAYVQGWVMALEAFLDTRPAEAVDYLMPHDLVFSEVFALKRPQTAEEFAAAHRTKKRFGKP